MTSKKLLFFLTTISILSGSSSVGYPQNIQCRLQEKLNDIQSTYKMPGITATVVLPNGKAHSVAAGFKDIDSKTSLNSGDRMMSGSTGKTFVAAIISRLEEENLLNYNDIISSWLADEPFWSQIPNGNSITISMLLSHKTGWVQHFFESERFQKDVFEMLTVNPDKSFSPLELFQYVIYDKPLFDPGESFHYSDMNYIALGIIIEKIMGKPYYQVLEELILRPFHLNNTIPADRRELEGITNGYINPLDPVSNLSPTILINGKLLFNPSLEWTGGGLATNSFDLARWAKILWNSEWLSEESVSNMTQSYGSDPRLNIEGYGFGTEIWQTELGILYGHTGFFPGFNTIMGYLPEKQMSVAIQISRDYDNGNLKDLLLDLAKVILEE